MLFLQIIDVLEFLPSHIAVYLFFSLISKSLFTLVLANWLTSFNLRSVTNCIQFCKQTLKKFGSFNYCKKAKLWGYSTKRLKAYVWSLCPKHPIIRPKHALRLMPKPLGCLIKWCLMHFFFKMILFHYNNIPIEIPHKLKLGLGRVEPNPYHCLFEVNKLFSKDPWLKQITTVIKWIRIVRRNMTTHSKVLRCIYTRSRSNDNKVWSP